MARVLLLVFSALWSWLAMQAVHELGHALAALATGGTIDACCQLVEHCGARVAACAFLIELTPLGGRDRIAPREVFSLLQY